MNVKNYQTSNLSKWSLRVADERSRFITMLTEGLSANSSTFKDSFRPGLSTRRPGGFEQTRRVSTLAIHERELHAKRDHMVPKRGNRSDSRNGSKKRA
jgi:hypothetical protein